jgi:hypothetical protein
MEEALRNSRIISASSRGQEMAFEEIGAHAAHNRTPFADQRLLG